MTQRDASGKFTGPDIFGDAMRARMGRKGGRVPSNRPTAVDPATPDSGGAAGPETASQDLKLPLTGPNQQLGETDSPSGGFGGGVQSAAPPAGENWGDEMRRRAMGG
jgi:hypothetical protein